MKLSSSKKEVVTVIFGSLILTGYSLFLSLPNVQLYISQMISSEVLLQKFVLLPVIFLSAIILFTGLIIGMYRHRDISPITFAILGISVLPLFIFWDLPLLLPALCSLCFFIAGLWNIVLPKNNKELQEIDTPTFDSFLDNTILPEEKND
ncbi:MAG: hypothetical protein KAS32_18345 [Candidatus Peribacteraceae bacterium]|nr:hypothetical protein [Candidatus Peribacteraceae bacterium]